MNFLRHGRPTLTGVVATLLLLSASSSAAAAEPLAYTKRLSDLEGRWALLPPKPGKDLQLFGFVYVDPEAGFTLDVGGLLKVEPDGKYVRASDGNEQKARVMIRIDTRNNARAAPLPKEAIAQLGLEEYPEIIKSYRDLSDPVTHRVTWGRHLNHVGDCARALEYLEPAYGEQPGARGLEFELAYAYNELRRPDDALTVLQKAVARDPGDLLLGVELAYAYMSSNRSEEAIELYLKLIPRCGEDRMLQKSEMAYNLSGLLARLGDTKSAEKWRANAKEWAPKGTPLYEHLNR